ncbi:ABC transporter permease [Oceanobacter mangrovi]|uniref:ABC transporter permease n=1 Tax=Oceanobacter mangrovi TaxID=2862510 RepID=UPI001C8D9F71|nr:ABC transporter permease [Oceanobacter mangrovi]
MKRMLLKRLLQLLLMAWSIGTLTFVLVRSLPGDMAYRIAAERYGDDAITNAAADAVRAELGLQLPAWQHYLNWLGELLQGNLGNSLVSGDPVIDSLQHQLGFTLALVLGGLLVSLLLALPIGLLAGWQRDRLADHVSLLLSTLIRAQPVFSVGLLLIFLLALNIHWLPVAGFGELKQLILPTLTLGISMAAVSSRIIRNSTASVISSPYYQFARIKGLSRWQTFCHHGGRNIAVPVVAYLGIQTVMLIEGVIMIESLFAWPGIGHALSHAIFARDVPMIQGSALLMGVLFVLINTAVDGLCLWLDPRGQAT